MLEYKGPFESSLENIRLLLCVVRKYYVLWFVNLYCEPFFNLTTYYSCCLDFCGTLYFLNSKPFHFIMKNYLYKSLMTWLPRFSNHFFQRLMYKKAKHCLALSTNFLFLFSWYFFLIMFCFLLNWRKNSNSSK